MKELKEIRLFRTIGINCERIKRTLDDITRWGRSVSINYKSLSFGVDIELVVEGENPSIVSSLTKGIEKHIKERLSDNIYSTEENLERVLGYLLYLKKLTLGIAESCSGGLTSHLITNVPGSSFYFKGGIIAYSNSIKVNVLGVSEKTIERFGAVSKNTASEMAIGIKNVINSDLGLSITGIAGPSGATEKKPIGLVYIGLSHNKDTIVKEFLFSGTRESIKEQSAYYAMDLIRRTLIK